MEVHVEKKTVFFLHTREKYILGRFDHPQHSLIPRHQNLIPATSFLLNNSLLFPDLPFSMFITQEEGVHQG